MPAEIVKIDVKQGETLSWWDLSSLLTEQSTAVSINAGYVDIWQDITSNLSSYKKIIVAEKRKVSEKHKETFSGLEKLIVKIDSENFPSSSRSVRIKNLDSEKFDKDLFELVAYLEKLQFPFHTRNSYLLTFKNSAVEMLTKNLKILRGLEFKQLKSENKELKAKNDEFEATSSADKTKIEQLEKSRERLQSNLKVRTISNDFHKNNSTDLNKDIFVHLEKIKSLEENIEQLTQLKAQLESDLVSQSNLHAEKVNQLNENIRSYEQSLRIYQDLKSELDTYGTADPTQRQSSFNRARIAMDEIGKKESIAFLQKQNEELKQENVKLKSKFQLLITFINRSFAAILAKDSKLKNELDGIDNTDNAMPSLTEKIVSRFGFFSKSSQPKSTAVGFISADEPKPGRRLTKQ